MREEDWRREERGERREETRDGSGGKGSENMSSEEKRWMERGHTALQDGQSQQWLARVPDVRVRDEPPLVPGARPPAARGRLPSAGERACACIDRRGEVAS